MESPTMLLPQVKRTGQVALASVSVRESESTPGTATIRLGLPAEDLLVLAPNGDRTTLDVGDGEPVTFAEYRVVLS